MALLKPSEVRPRLERRHWLCSRLENACVGGLYLVSIHCAGQHFYPSSAELLPSTGASKYLFCAVDLTRVVPPKTWLGVWKMELRDCAKLGFIWKPCDLCGLWASGPGLRHALFVQSLISLARNLSIFYTYIKTYQFHTRMERPMETSTGSTSSPLRIPSVSRLCRSWVILPCVG